MSVIYRDNVVRGTGTALFLTGLTGALTGSFLNLQNLYQEYFRISGVGGDLPESTRDQYLFAMRNMAVNTILVIYSLSKYYIAVGLRKRPPSVILGGIPCATIDELSHAMSHELLKYRSKAGVFLAHQPGGNQTLRITGKAIGRNKYIFLIMLDMLFRYGNSRMMDLLANFPSSVGSEQVAAHYSMLDVPKLSESLNLDPWEILDRDSVDVGREEFHYTFPVVTKDRVYTNMYIETYEFTESIENGMDVISFTIFLRKFDQKFPNKYSASYPSDLRRPVIYYYKEDEDDETMKKLSKWDNFMDYSMSTALITTRIGMILASNTPERTISALFGMRMSSHSFGFDKAQINNMIEKLDEISNGSEVMFYTVRNKEELMQID